MVFPFEREAEQGAPMPDGLDIPDQCAFRFLSNMYAQIRSGSLSREQAIVDKKRMEYEHSTAKNILHNSSVMGKFWANLRRDLEGANNRYRLNPTRENADALSAALDGRL